jgi:DNA-binding MarR family transcriptional regulator
VSGSKAVGFQSEQFLRLQMLRELDSAIDFARGFLQLRIVLALGSRGPMTARDISTSLGERYKAVLDAVRKLITKNLIAKEPDGGIDTYRLSDAGVEFYRKLVEILGVREHYRVPKEERRMLLSDVAMSITKYTHLADAILALGTSRSNALTLSDIADAMKLSPERAKTYIEMFSDRRSGVKLFKKVEKELKMLKLIAALLKPFGIKMRTAVEMYRLTEEGLTVFYKQPYYLKYKKSLAAKIVTKVFGTAHPRLVLKRMTLVTLIAALISSAIALITHNTATVALTGSLSVASSLLYLGYKAI